MSILGLLFYGQSFTALGQSGAGHEKTFPCPQGRA